LQQKYFAQKYILKTTVIPNTNNQCLFSQSAESGAWKELRDRKPYPISNPSLEDSIVEVQKSWAKFTLLESRERVLPRIQSAPENCKLNMLLTSVMRAPGQLMLSKSSPYKAALDQQYVYFNELHIPKGV